MWELHYLVCSRRELIVLILVCVEVSVGEIEKLTQDAINRFVLILVCVEVSVGGFYYKSYIEDIDDVLILVCVEVSVGE